MTALVAVAAHVPDKSVPIEDLAAEFGLTPMQTRVFRRYHKLGEVRMDPGGSLLDLLRPALAGLGQVRGREHRVRYVVHARSFPVVVPFPLDPVRELCREFGLERANVLAVGHHACATGLLAVDAVGRLLAGDELAVVLTGEKAFTPDARMVPDTTFFGEGAAACLVGAGEQGDRVLSYAVEQRGEYDDEAESAGDALAYQQEYPDRLAATILAAVERAGLSGVEELGLILPHNVNVVGWQQVCRRLGYPLARVVLENVPTHGHMFCADTFINYLTAERQGLLRPGAPYLMAAAGAGMGATYCAMVLEHHTHRRDRP
jgi:3-oxoacyl-[acyl-carrier-protein] synthase-3